jgi:hypothetical protein
MLIDCEPLVAFSIIHIFETSFGAKVKVLVAVKETPEVTLKYKLRAGSVAPSAIVVVASASELKDASVP